MEDKAEKTLEKKVAERQWDSVGEKIKELENQLSMFHIKFSSGILNKEDTEEGYLNSMEERKWSTETYQVISQIWGVCISRMKKKKNKTKHWVLGTSDGIDPHVILF